MTSAYSLAPDTRNVIVDGAFIVHKLVLLNMSAREDFRNRADVQYNPLVDPMFQKNASDLIDYLRTVFPQYRIRFSFRDGAELQLDIVGPLSAIANIVLSAENNIIYFNVVRIDTRGNRVILWEAPVDYLFRGLDVFSLLSSIKS